MYIEANDINESGVDILQSETVIMSTAASSVSRISQLLYCLVKEMM